MLPSAFFMQSIPERLTFRQLYGMIYMYQYEYKRFPVKFATARKLHARSIAQTAVLI